MLLLPLIQGWETHPSVKRYANSVARRNGAGKATRIKIDRRLRHKGRVTSHTSHGYVKDSTGEYVPKSYVNKCRGRGVHYVAAECEVAIPPAIPA